MYRCTECHAEYEIKPDYCECSNDVFEEILSSEATPKQNEPQKEPVKINETEFVHKQTGRKNENQSEPFSLISIVVSIILSFLIILFVANPKEKIEVPEKQSEIATIPAEIPAVDTFWDNTPIEIKNQKVREVAPLKAEIPLQTVNKTKQNISKVKQKEKPKQTIVKTEKSKRIKDTIVSPKTNSAEKQRVQPAENKQQSSIQKKETPAIKQPVVDKQEFMKYKVSLRNMIARKINFANIIGDGTCVVTFVISSTGEIKNKKFKLPSDNFTLNDVVYSAFGQISSYNPPPSGYKGETLSFTVKMYGGNFEVSLH